MMVCSAPDQSRYIGSSGTELAVVPGGWCAQSIIEDDRSGTNERTTLGCIPRSGAIQASQHCQW
jgi:hypothetical protein